MANRDGRQHLALEVEGRVGHSTTQARGQLVHDGQAGLTYATDAYGRVLDELDAWEVGEITADVPLHDLDTLYRRIGLGWSFIWAGLVLLPLVSKRFTRRLMP